MNQDKQVEVLLLWLQQNAQLKHTLEANTQPQPGTASNDPRAISIPVDLVALAQDMPEIAVELHHVLEAYNASLSQSLQHLIPPGFRLWLRPTSCFNHHASVQQLCNAAIHGATSQLMAFTGLVQAISTPVMMVFSRCLICPACKSQQDVLDGQDPCCVNCGPGTMATEWQENMAARVLAPVQRIWISDAPSIPHFHASCQSVVVSLHDDLCSSPAVQLGAPVTIIGTTQLGLATTVSSGTISPAASLYVKATNILPADTFSSWLPSARTVGAKPMHTQTICPPPRLTNQSPTDVPHLFGQPLSALTSFDVCNPDVFQSLVSALLDGVGSYVCPSLALGMLVSAAFTGCAVRQLQSGNAATPGFDGTISLMSGSRVNTQQYSIQEGTNKIGNVALQQSIQTTRSPSLLVLHPPHEPAAFKTLQTAGNILSPISISPHGPQVFGDLLLPRLDKDPAYTDAATAEGATLLQSSQLTSANAGVFVLDGNLLLSGSVGSASKTRIAQLTSSMSVSHFRLGRLKHEMAVPQTATVWCAAAGKLGTSAGLEAAGFPVGRFSLLLQYAVSDEIAAMCTLSAGCDLVTTDERDSVLTQIERLRNHMALVSRIPSPATVTEQAQACLQAYFKAMRSMRLNVHAKEVLESVIGCATGCARLLLRNQVLPHPDCTIAILLMEESLALRFSSQGYCSSLDLGPPLDLGSSLLDHQLEQVRDKLQDQLQAFGLNNAVHDSEDGADGPLRV